MIIVYGTRCYGKADVIDGLGHVTCRFVHIMFVPLIPIETLFLVSDDRGMKLPFSFKAALSGWMRAGAILAGLGFLAGAVENFGEGEPVFGVICAVLGLVSFGAFPFWGWVFGKCSQQRKMELMGMMGVSPADMGHSAPSPAYPQPGAYPQPVGYPQPGAYGGPQPGGYGAPPPQPGGYGAPPPQLGGYGAPPPAPGYAGGYGAPQPQAGGYGAPPAGGFGAPQPSPYGGPQPGGYGGPQPPGYGPPQGGGWNPNGR